MQIISPMLAQKVEPGTVVELARSDLYANEFKVDGDRLLMHVDGGKIMPISRNGKHLPCNRAVLGAFEPFAAGGNRWVFDGEYLDSHFYIFDLVEAPRYVQPYVSPDDPGTLFEERRDILESFVSKLDLPPEVVLLPSYRETEDKVALIKQVSADNSEGVVFKRLDSPYIPGKRKLYWAKYKFRHDVDCIVVDRNRDGHRNFVLALWDPESSSTEPIEVGEVTALAGDGATIEVGMVVTVVYLYATDARRLYQPTKPRIRHDKASADCTMDQLVYPTKTPRGLT